MRPKTAKGTASDQCLLLVVYIFNQIDRSIFSFLMEPIRIDLKLSDAQLGFLAGPALVLFYALLGVPIARLADRGSRVNVMSVALWSGIVMLSAAVATFGQFALARVGVGIGEAGFSAIALSLLADYHAPAERTRAMSMFMLAIPLGSVASSLMSGWVNEAYGWRATFIVAGLPGILLALLLKGTVRELPHRRAAPPAVTDASQPSPRRVFTAIWRCRSLRHLAVAMGATNIVWMCMLAWVPTFFIRVHGMSTGEVGPWLALLTGVGGSVGTWLGGHLASHRAREERVQARLIAAATGLMAPALIAALWCPARLVALLLFLPAYALMFFFSGPAFSLVQGLSAANMRATMASVFILIQILSGGVLGVQLLGLISDRLTVALGENAAALRWSMTAICLPALWAAAHFWRAGRFIQDDLQLPAYKTAVEVTL